MARQKERRAATRDAILNAAEKLFRRKGFEETAVEEITAAANVAKGTFYQHFESKPEVLMALIRRHNAATAEAVEARLQSGAPPLELGRALIRGMADAFERDRKMAVSAVTAAMANPAKKGEPSLRTALALVFAEAQKRRMVRQDSDPYDLALMLMGAVLPQIIVWATEPAKKGVLSARLDRAWRTLLEGFQA